MSDSTQNPPSGDPDNPGTPPPPPAGPPTGGYLPPSPNAGPGMATGGVGQPADLLMRFLARLIDLILVGVVNAILVSVVVVGAIMGTSGGMGLGYGGSFAAGAVYSLLTAAISLGYFAVMESRNGQTIGKMLLKLQTQGLTGATPTMEEALKRNAWVALGVLGIIPILGGFVAWVAQVVAVVMIAVTINNSPTKQGWHDNFAGGTKVIKIG